MNKNKFLYISAAAIFLIGALVFFVFRDGTDTERKDKKAIDKNTLVGDWIRTDAQYLIRIIKLSDDGIMTTQYFNPNTINVGRANWEENYGNLRIVVEMRDVNYPGSKYTLNYLPDKDMLAGEYYQAVEGLTFYVEFTRRK